LYRAVPSLNLLLITKCTQCGCRSRVDSISSTTPRGKTPVHATPTHHRSLAFSSGYSCRSESGLRRRRIKRTDLSGVHNTSVRLIFFIRSTVPSPRSSYRYSFLPIPIPRSLEPAMIGEQRQYDKKSRQGDVHVPSSAITRWTIRFTRSFWPALPRF
jgi:hypothetical protein